METRRGASGIVNGLAAVAFAAFALIGSAGATSANTDVTDIWWNSNESGWGLQLINTGTFVFATGFIYGHNNEPFWVVANLHRDPGNPEYFSGNLVVTTGRYFPVENFNELPVTRRVAGTMEFVLTSDSTAELHYSVDGLTVDKLVERQPLTLDDYGGKYEAILTAQPTVGCSPLAGQPGTGRFQVEISQNGHSMSQVWSSVGRVCTFNGTYSQRGRMGRFVSASGSCTGPGVNPIQSLTMEEMTNVPNMFMAKVQQPIPEGGSGCLSAGEVAAVIPRPR